MTSSEKKKLIKDIFECAESDILQQEDMAEINKIIQRACRRTLAEIDGPYPIYECAESDIL